MSILTESVIQMTFAELSQEKFQKPIAGASASLVKTFQSQAKGKDLEEIGQDYFFELLHFLKTSKKKIDPTLYSLKMYAIFFRLIGDLTLPDFSLSWTKSGTMRSGKLSTRNTTVYHKTESECSLLDILEDEVDEKYFLSREQAEKIVFAK